MGNVQTVDEDQQILECFPYTLKEICGFRKSLDDIRRGYMYGILQHNRPLEVLIGKMTTMERFFNDLVFIIQTKKPPKEIQKR